MTDHPLPDLPPERIEAVAQRHAHAPHPYRPSRANRLVPWVGAACVLGLAALTGWSLSIAQDANGQVSQLRDGQTALGQALDKANDKLRQHGVPPVATPTAVPGLQGSTGATGPAGPSGASGANGSTGPHGPRGGRGPSGKPGRSGQPGPVGGNGQNGAQGPPGPTGATGPSGPVGPVGPQGPGGPQGSTGPQGTKGDQGDTGSSGDAGEPPQSWTFVVLGVTYDCTRDQPFDPQTPTYTCQPQIGP